MVKLKSYLLSHYIVPNIPNCQFPRLDVIIYIHNR